MKTYGKGSSHKHALCPRCSQMEGAVSKVGRRLKGRVEDKPLQSGVVYIGHLPHGFYEEQLRSYFSQFGTVEKIKVARNKKVYVFSEHWWERM